MMQLEIHDQSMTMLTMRTKNKKRTRKAAASNRSLRVLEISTTMLTMLTKNEKIAPKRRVRRTELTRAAAGKSE